MLRRVSKRREVSSIVAITPDGRLYARHFRTSIASRCVIQALRFFRRTIGTPLLVVWARLNAHRSRATTDSSLRMRRIMRWPICRRTPRS